MELNIRVGEKALITCNNWFYGPNGRQYRAAFGTVKAVVDAQTALGIKTNAHSTNWYIEIGNLTIAGCQIQYALRAEECDFGPALDWTTPTEGASREFMRPSAIYNADA